MTKPPEPVVTGELKVTQVDESYAYAVEHLPMALREVAANVFVECAPYVLEDMARIANQAADLIEGLHRTANALPGDVGMRVVPVEPTEAMYLAAFNSNLWGGERPIRRVVDEIWSAMLSAALTPSALSGDAGEGRTWPAELTQGLREILGIPNFQCGPMAHAYQKIGEFSGTDGLALEKRAEDEQAFILHKLVRLWFEHGDDWREPAIDEIDRAAKLARAASHQGAGEP